MPENNGVKEQLQRILFILKHSITKRLLVVVFSIYLILTITVTLAQMNYEYEVTKEHTLKALENIQAMTQDSLNQAVWEFNATQIDSILKGINTNKFLVGEKLLIENNSEIPELKNQQSGYINDVDGKMLYIDPVTQNTTLVTNTLERLIPYFFDVYHVDANNNKQIIGKLELYSSNKIVFDQVKGNFILLIVNAFIKTIALWICFLWAGYEFISKPLAQLTSAIKKLSSGNWDADLVFKSKNDKDKTEINTLIDSFNDMTHKLFAAQSNLEKTSKRFSNIFNTMPSSLIFIDHKFIIKGWNKYMERLTDIEATTAIGHPLLDIYAAFTDYFYLVHNAINTGKKQQIINAHLVMNSIDANRLFDITVYPTTGAMPDAVIRIDDVTEQVKNEAGLAQVEKLASVGALIAGVAHEINNPLGSIMQGTQNVLRRIDPELEANQQAATEFGIDLIKQKKYLEQREIITFLDNIRAAGERASSIVKNMLNFTRRSTADMSKHNIVDLINDGLQLASTDFSLQEKIDFKKIKVKKELCSKEIMVECYPMEIQQVILNILKNAAQAFDANATDKQISISLKTHEKDKITITISDNGSGMPEDIKLQIFKPFFTTKPIGEGTGLGLSVCRNIIVQKHRGSMKVESTVGVGTKFIITLPINQAV